MAAICTITEAKLAGSIESMLKTFIRTWIPTGLRNIANRVLGATIDFKGPYADWRTAHESTEGYNQDAILDRVSRATRHVLEGSAVYEQDGVEFHDAPPPSHALNGLLIAAAIDSGRLSVLDFGGALASHYLRWRSLLAALSEVHWAVVEQPNFVAEGLALFERHPSVSFHKDIADVPSHPNVVLASGVLQYLPEPHQTLQRLIQLAPRVIVLDRMPLGEKELVMTQSVPQHFGKASYPLWVLTREKIHAALSRDYTLINESDALDQPLHARGIRAPYRGSIWLRRM